MNKMREIISISVVFLTIWWCSFSVSAQFNTVLPKEKIKEEIVNEIIEAQAQGTKATIEKANIPEERQYVIDGMMKRQNLALPIDEIKVNSLFGYRSDPFTGKRTFHRGIDLDADFHYVYSIMPGRVVRSGKNRTLGEFVQVEHGEFVTTYAHLFQRLVAAKQTVEAGQRIGVSGSSGRSTGEHLHFQMSHNGKIIDPLPILNYISHVMQEAKREIENALNSLNINK